MTVLDHNLPADTRYVLSHVTDDLDDHQQTLAEFEDLDRVRTVDDQTPAGKAYLIYVNDAPKTTLPPFETDDELRQWLRERFDPDELRLVLLVWRAYMGVVDETADQEERLQYYKQMEWEAIPGAFDRVQWRQSVSTVGAELLSEFVRTHPMPNANHRTGITVLERYLRSVDDTFEMPVTGEQGEWYDWIAGYIYDSKRLLTLQWKLPVFRHAARVGYETVRRKDGTTIDLTDVDLSLRNHHEYYAEQHQERTQQFVEELLESTDSTHLLEATDQGKRTFVDRL